jgi:two-component system nitrogen regulation response regulator NtrX
VVERMAILSSGPRITGEAVPLEIQMPQSSRLERRSLGGGGSGLQDVRDSAERDRIRQALEDADWNVSRAARALGIERTGLHKRMRALGLARSK